MLPTSFAVQSAAAERDYVGEITHTESEQDGQAGEDVGRVVHHVPALHQPLVVEQVDDDGVVRHIQPQQLPRRHRVTRDDVNLFYLINDVTIRRSELEKARDELEGDASGHKGDRGVPAQQALMGEPVVPVLVLGHVHHQLEHGVDVDAVHEEVDTDLQQNDQKRVSAPQRPLLL